MAGMGCGCGADSQGLTRSREDEAKGLTSGDVESGKVRTVQHRICDDVCLEKEMGEEVDQKRRDQIECARCEGALRETTREENRGSVITLLYGMPEYNKCVSWTKPPWAGAE